MNQRAKYGVIAFGAVISMVAAFLEVLEVIILLKDQHATLACNLSSVFSCSSVLDAWQSWVFGFPNAVMCLMLFTIFTFTALVGLTGGTITRAFRLVIQGLALFTLGFGLWFLWQSTYAIGALCILCIFCMGGLLLINWGWLRLNAADLPCGKILALKSITTKGYDTLFWLLLALLIAILMILRFAF